MPSNLSPGWLSTSQLWYRHLDATTKSQVSLGMTSPGIPSRGPVGKGKLFYPGQHHLPTLSHGEEIMLTQELTAVSSLQHPLQGDLPLSDHLVLPVLGVPALDGPSKLWRYQGKSGFSHPLWGGKRWEAPCPLGAE